MKSTSPVVPLLAAAAIGALSAAVTTSLMSPGAPRESEQASPAALVPEPSPEPSSVPELLDQIRGLRDANQELRQRLAALELRPAPETRSPAQDFVPREVFDAFKEEVEDWMVDRIVAAADSPEQAATPEFREQVAEALQSIRKNEAVVRVKKDQEHRAAELEERVTRVSEWLALDSFQTNEMRTILSEKDERDRLLIRMWEEGTDNEVLGDTKRANREEFQTALERVLAPQQLETFRSKYGGDGKDR